MAEPLEYLDYPSSGSDARIRITFTTGAHNSGIPTTAHFLRLNQNGFPDGDALRVEHGPWRSLGDARGKCWEIARSLDRSIKKTVSINELEGLISDRLKEITGRVHSPMIVKLPGETPNWRTIDPAPDWAKEAISALQEEFEVLDGPTAPPT